MTKIVLIRYRDFYKSCQPMIDIEYQSGRKVSLGEDELSKTAKDFMENATAKYIYDPLYGHSFVYKKAW